MDVDGNQLTGLVRKDRGDTLVDLENGAQEATCTFHCAWREVLRLKPRKNQSTHPDFNNMICSGSRARKIKGQEVAEVVATYTGSINAEETGSGGAGDDPIEELQNVTSTEPIETHPDFRTFATAENGAKFDSEGLFQGFGEPDAGGENFEGITDYYVPRTTFSRTVVQRTKPDAITSMAAIDTPSGAPTLPDGRTWLKVVDGWRRNGGYYEITQEWLSSSEGGWNTTIYD